MADQDKSRSEPVIKKAHSYFHSKSKSEPVITLQSIRDCGEHNCRQIIKEYVDDINAYEKAKHQKTEEKCNMKQHWPCLREKIFGNIDEEVKYDNDSCSEEYMRVLKHNIKYFKCMFENYCISGDMMKHIIHIKIPITNVDSLKTMVGYESRTVSDQQQPKSPAIWL
eukprot:539546_1